MNYLPLLPQQIKTNASESAFRMFSPHVAIEIKQKI